MVIANMYIGGCSIERHVGNVRDDKPDYRLCLIAADGSRTVREGVRLSEVIGLEPWDFVTVQQASPDSGMPETYALLPELVQWIKAGAPQATILFHQTWAYGPHATHSAFPRYGSDQLQMYDAIMHAVRSEVPHAGIRRFIPSGTAIQDARTTRLGNDLTRDGYHLSYGIGRYIAACTWFEALTGRSVVGNTYRPDGSEHGTEAITAADALIAQRAAHKANRHPFRIRRLKGDS